jgi:zinc-ribbon domain
VGGSQRFCVQCGYQLKPDSRFCVACGHVVPAATQPQAASEQPTIASGRGPTPTLFAPVPDTPVRPSSPAEDQTWPPGNQAWPSADQAPSGNQTWPSGNQAWPPQEAYHPTEATPAMAQHSFSPPDELSPPDSYPPQPDSYPPQPGSYPPQPDSYSPGPAGFPTQTHVPGYSSDPGDRQPAVPRHSPPPGGPPRSRRAGGPPHSRRSAGPSRSRRVLVLVLTLLLAAGVAAAVAFLALRSPHTTQPSAGATQRGAANQGNAQATTGSPSASSTPASSPAQVTEQQAATNLAGLLTQSVKDRSSIAAAASDVSDCGPALSQDAQTFQSAAAHRQELLSQLASLPGRSVLSASMIQALTGAWQASAAADQDLGKWAQDEATQGCTENDQTDANYVAAEGPDDQATTDKKAFVSQWNPVASQYGLTQYQWDQL